MGTPGRIASNDDRQRRTCARGQAARRRRSHGPRLGAYPARFQGRAVVRERERRLLLRGDPGGRRGHAGQLRERGEAPHRRLRGDRHRHPGALAGPGPGVRDPGIATGSRGLGRGSGNLPDPAQGAFAGIPARSRAPAPAHQPVRRGRAHPRLPGEGGAPLFPRTGLLLDLDADHHLLRRRGCGADVPRVHPGPGQPAARRHRRAACPRAHVRRSPPSCS
jgi:hypothetical protein